MSVRTMSRFVALVGLLVGPLAVPVLTAPPAQAAIDPATLGTTSDQAAGSCWEIKQVRPSATDGAYWLLTPTMSEPMEYYCDMTTDGGGWVLVGKGREGWTIDYDGKGVRSDLLTTAPGALTTTTQLGSKEIDGLLNGGRVDALADGVRLRRAINTAGTVWQEVRTRFSKFPAWAWTFGAEWPLASYSFDGVTGVGGTSPNYGLDTRLRRVTNTPSRNNTFHYGFALGSQVTGLASAASYLYSSTNNATAPLPYTYVYLRPKVTSTDAGFTAIGDNGTAAYTLPAVARSNALPAQWGVTGLAGNTSQEGNVEVQAFTQSGNRMYVGGNFRTVQRDAAGTGAVNQSFLAAFDVTTGEFLPGFAPVLNEQVHTLTTLPNGSVLAGGEFTQANGQAATGIVALDPVSGATDSSFKVTLQDRLVNDVFRVNTLAVSGGYVYIGGALTHVSGGSRPNAFVYSRGLVRVAAATGLPDSNWKPTFNGSVTDVSPSPDGDRVYAVGYMTTSNGLPANRAAALLTAPGAALATPAWSPSWSNASKNYQHTVEAVGNKVWVGGSEHSLFQFDSSTFTRTMGDIMKAHGDVQDVTDVNGAVYAGCHCDEYDYRNAYTWSSVGSSWTRADAMRWVGAWDAGTGARIPSFTPNMVMRTGTGIWALEGDSNGILWAGGDIVTAATPARVSSWSGGFARFPQVDNVAPTVPTNLRATTSTGGTVTLTWNRSTDLGGGTRYVILRDDRPIAATSANVTTLTVPLGGSNRFFVRAVDAAGNYSASSPSHSPGSVAAPVAAFTSTMTGLSGSFDASASTDDGAIVSYSWAFGDGGTANGPVVTHDYAAAGDYTVTVTVTDDEGLTGTSSRSVSASLPAGDTVVVDNREAWSWKYDAEAPPAGWNAPGFDASGWSTGNAVLGFGSSGLGTNINTFATTAERPIAAYYRRTFTVPDVGKATRLVLTTVGDDGVVVYVNGVEVGRQNMPTGAVSSRTYASSARRTTVANSSPLVIEVPVNLLVSGTNVVSAETHLNYRGTPDTSFDLKAVLTADR